MAGWLFLIAEAGYLALETGPSPVWPWRRLLTALAIAGGSSLAGILLLALNQSLRVSSPLLSVAGIASALLIVGLVAGVRFP